MCYKILIAKQLEMTDRPSGSSCLTIAPLTNGLSDIRKGLKE